MLSQIFLKSWKGMKPNYQCVAICFFAFTAVTSAFLTRSYDASPGKRSTLATYGTAKLNSKTRNLPMQMSDFADGTVIPLLSVATHSISSTYSAALYEYPLQTKSITACVLCGIGDLLAQSRNADEEINWRRFLNFSLKGSVGGIIWATYYDASDSISEAIDFRIEGFVGSSSGGGNIVTHASSGAEEFSAVVRRTLISILFEQFVWCPLVFSFWELPVSTLLNGGRIATIPDEVGSKLGGLLVSNAKVWTPANVLIYNIPSEYRVGMSNLVDIVWQSIVSDVAAECGSTTFSNDDAGMEVVMASNTDLRSGTRDGDLISSLSVPSQEEEESMESERIVTAKLATQKSVSGIKS